MNDEFSEVWQSQQPTGVAPPSLEEIRQRAHRLKGALDRRQRITVAAWILVLLVASGSLIFFEEPVTVWFRAAQFVLYAVILIAAPRIFRRTPLRPEGNVLTLNMLAGSTPCLVFYRTELLAQVEELRQKRFIAPLLIFEAMYVLISSPWSRNPLPTGLAGAIIGVLGLWWFLQIRRQSPRIRRELNDLEALPIRQPE